MALGRKSLLILIPIALVVLFAGYEGARVWWYRGYSVGARTGVIRKLSIKGPPYCKYLAGELVLQGTVVEVNGAWGRGRRRLARPARHKGFDAA